LRPRIAPSPTPKSAAHDIVAAVRSIAPRRSDLRVADSSTSACALGSPAS
jgi:hypothetical protein